MNKEELAVETRMRGVLAELTNREQRKLLDLLLERTEVDEIAETIKMQKLSGEVNQICHKISNF